MDAKYVDVSASSGYYSQLKDHTIIRENEKIIIDGQAYTLYDDDYLLCYIRKQGTYKSTTTPNSSNTYIKLKDISINRENQTGTSELSFSPMEIFDITNNSFNDTFNASTSHLSKFSGTQVNNQLFNSLICTVEKMISMPNISGADHGLREGSLFTGGDVFATLGNYSYETTWLGHIKPETISNTSSLTYSMDCTFKNFSYIGTISEEVS